MTSVTRLLALCIALLAAALADLSVANAAQPQIHGVRMWAGPDHTRVVLDLSQPVEHKLFALSDPDRVVIDLKNSRFDRKLDSIPDGKGYVDGIRSARRENGDLRIVLDLSRSVTPKSFHVRPNDQYGHRLVIDLDAPEPRKKVIKLPANEGYERDVLVAVDAGHGGEDPGAIGRKGTREKDIVLSISRKLAAKIDQQPGMRAYLTRDGDYFVPLRTRMEKARRQSADFFVSIHADANRNRSVYGSSVYALSQRGASDEAAKRLAQRENASDLIGGVSLSDKDDVLASVLLDLSQNAAISASLRAGNNVIGELDGIGAVRKIKVMQAPFAVLKSPDIPSILVETAFISNPKEEKRLKNVRYQDELAAAIMMGVRGYFYDNPPPGTLIAKLRNQPGAMPVSHVISRGDTLSTIANRYNVSVRNIKTANNLKTDRIVVGKTLSIPMAGY